MSDSRGLHIVVVVATAVALVGLVSGVRGTGRDVESFVSERPSATVAREARSYADMRHTMYGPNGELPPMWWTTLGGIDLFAPVVQTDAQRDAALARRASRRAFDGAPPVIPHAIDQRRFPACLTCHEGGVKIAGLIAPRMSHAPLGSCVQCHVVATDPRPGVTTPPAPVTTFVGLVAPRSVTRAWPGAPPTIPHTTWMRERCDSCHGVFGAAGMKTTHPWRQSCTQCHAPSAERDQRPPVTLAGGVP